MSVQRSASGKPEGRVLLEIFAVVAILVVLLLIILPLIRGYVDDAAHRQAVDQCGAHVIAAQTLVNELYGLGHCGGQIDDGRSVRFSADEILTGQPHLSQEGRSGYFCQAIQQLSDAGGEVLSVIASKDGRVAAMDFLCSNGRYVWYRDGEYYLEQPEGSL